MRVLIDLVHPAHFHFFRNCVSLLREEGHEVYLAGREKDILVELAQEFGCEVDVFGVARKGVFNLAKELLYRQYRLFRIIRKFRPQVMMGIAGPYISSLGWITRIPTYVFYDTEHATLSNLMAYPFCTCVYVPGCYLKDIRWRHERYNGYHELAYLHPKYFTPDDSVLAEAGLVPGERFVIVRFVGWGAAHDIGIAGFTDLNKMRAVKRFSRHAKVLISCEGDMPAELEPYRLKLKVSRMHHLMAHADLIFGESPTMCSEGAILGVPGVYLDPVGGIGYVVEQEKEYGIVFNLPPEQQEEAIEKGVSILEQHDPDTWRAIGQRIIREKIDVTELIRKVALERPHS